jgi:hypothetical protein
MTTCGAADIAAAADSLLGAWAQLHDPGREDEYVINQASLDAAGLPSPVPPNFAVGYSIDHRGHRRLSVRTTARGERLNQARSLIADFRLPNTEIDFRAIPQAKIAAGMLQSAGLGPAVLMSHCRPLHLGCSVSHENGPAGTLGAFVRADGQAGVLSCSHVLALGGDAAAGDPVCQPASQDQATLLGKNRIGTLTNKFAPLVAGAYDNLDAAVAALSAEAATSTHNVIPDLDLPWPYGIPGKLCGRPLGGLGSVTEQPAFVRVAKIGRTSGYTEGVLSVQRLINFTPTLRRKGKEQKYTFLDVIEVQSLSAALPFAQGGDSGAIVFTLPDLTPLGLHFCSLPLQGQPSLNYLMPLERICAKLSLEMM